ncbi:MAG TPA: redox-regulated ATPase YchF [Candidatus Aminicenantes bacterium]|nr:redox-regulated ATPase YchF [Candidatus Aminicenantes bacterium]
MILTIFGYPKTGKTLLFNLLARQRETVSKFSSSHNELHKAVVDVPDSRLANLAAHFDTPPVFAKIEYLDTGSMGYGEIENSAFVDLLRRGDGLIHIVRGFTDPEIPHPACSVDPQRDIDHMESEIIAVDFVSMDKRREKLETDMRRTGSRELKEEHDLMLRLQEHLEANRPLREYALNEIEASRVRGFSFLSQKPLLHLVNADENNYHQHLKLARPAINQRTVQVFCGRMETELLELDSRERALFQTEFGLSDYQYLRDSFIQTSYELMNLASFFTVGHDETRAWTISRGESAWNAAGKIHGDIQQGFIRAEVISWSDFLSAGGFSQAKEKGKLRLEGKDYPVKDGEIVHFRFNK